jgi:hypothetical protein
MPRIIADKEKAPERMTQLPAVLDIPSLGLDERTAANYKLMIDVMMLYVKMCVNITKAGYLARIVLEGGDGEDWDALRKAVPPLYAWSDEADRFLQGTDYPYYIYARLPADKMRIFAQSLEALPGYHSGKDRI